METVENPIVISWSEIETYRQCPFKHMLSYRERWQEPTTSAALQKGNLWHEVLEVWYKRLKWVGKRPRTLKIMKPAIDEIEKILGARDPNQTEIQQLIHWMFEGYLEQWGMDNDWDIVSVEDKMFAPLPNPHGGPSRFLIKVKMDLVVRVRSRLWLVDHKSGKDLPNDKELDLLDQFGLYSYVLRHNGMPIMGSFHNAARTQRNKTPMTLESRFSRTYVNFTDRQLETIAAEAYLTAEKMWPEQFGDLLPERTPNPDTCRWRCSFTEACLHGRKCGSVAMEQMLVAYGSKQRVFREVEQEWAEWKKSQ